MTKVYCELIRLGSRTISTIPTNKVVDVATVLIPEGVVDFNDVPAKHQPAVEEALTAAGYDKTGVPIE